MGILATFVDRRLDQELAHRKVVVWFDPDRSWEPWIESQLGSGSLPPALTQRELSLGGHKARLIASGGSHYEILQACEDLLAEHEPLPLLIYVPGEPYLEAHSPLRELECMGGEKDPYQKDLAQVARQAFQSAGLAEGKIDELLNREGLDFDYLDSVSVSDGGASPLSPVFGSSREIDVIPSFLADPEKRLQAAAKGLFAEVLKVAQAGLGLTPADEVADSTPAQSAERLATRMTRHLLIAELRSDLLGAPPPALSQIPGPTTNEQVERVRAVCKRLRIDYSDTYEQIADAVEQEMGLGGLGIEPQALGRIDTFRFEERQLLGACDRWLVEGEFQRVLDTVHERLSQGSFWASVARYPERHAAWEACGGLAQLARATDSVAKELDKAPKSPDAWIQAYTAAGGWHRLDQLFREARYRVTRIQGAAELNRGADRVFARYDAVLERMATGFLGSLQQAGWHTQSILRQEEIFDRHVARRAEPVAYFMADALRFEMGAELTGLLEAVGATSVQLQPAVAVAPTITTMGMAALLPGAERSFSMVQSAKGVCGAIDGQGLPGSTARMEHAKAQVPGLVEMTLDRLVHELTGKTRAEEIQGAKVVVIRSQEIDGAGENLPFGVAQKVMGTILEDLRTAVLCLSEAGIRRFVVTADHGHLFGQIRGDDMKIDVPEGGATVELHRRCWVGRGGTTPSSCFRLTASDLGYQGSDLDLVVPKGTGVFKSGGGLAFHHGGLSLQELVIPVLTFDLAGKKAAPKKAQGDPLLLEGIADKITNRIFAVRLLPQQLNLFDPLKVRIIAQATSDGSTAAQAAWASEGWDPEKKTVTLVSGQPVEVRLTLDDDQATELRIVVMEVETDRVLKDTQPIPVKLGIQ